MTTRACSHCGKPVQGDSVLCAAASAIAKPEHAEQAKVTPPSGDAAIREGEPPVEPKPPDPWPYKHEPGPWFGGVLGYGCVNEIVLGVLVVVALGIFIAPVCLNVRNAAVRTETINHMKEIAIGCHNYHDLHKELQPPTLVSVKDGKRVATPLSWRIAILPHAHLGPIFAGFDLAVGWDHEKNAPLQTQMPPIFTSPFQGESDPIRRTNFQCFTGPNSLFPAPDQAAFALSKIPDGASSTFLFAESDKTVLWTKPADMTIQKDQPLPLPEKEFYAAFGDGSVRSLHRDRTSDAVLRQLIDPNDGEPKWGDWN